MLFVALFLVFIFFKYFNSAPSCFDGVKNGDETGVDCGGTCSVLCSVEVLSPIVRWSKAFSISGDVYNIAAYVENPNTNSSNTRMSYEFKIFDERNILLGARKGETFVPNNKKFVVFEPSFVIPNRKPKYVDFTFKMLSPWVKDNTVEPEISVTHTPVQNLSSAPRIEGTISNKSLKNVENIELVALISDDKENVIAVSRTFIENLGKATSQDFVFTWPKPFDLGTESCEQLDEDVQNATSTINLCPKKPSVVTVIYRITQ